MMFTRDDKIHNSNNYIWFKCKYMLHEHMASECVNVPTLEPADPACGVRVVSPATPVLDSARFPHRRWKDKQNIYKYEYLDSKYKIYPYTLIINCFYLFYINLRYKQLTLESDLWCSCSSSEELSKVTCFLPGFGVSSNRSGTDRDIVFLVWTHV